MNGVWALTVDGKLTLCKATEETRGKGRCKHVAHQAPGQSLDDFFKSVNEKIAIETANEQVDQKPYILKIVKKYGRTNNPDWKNMISSIDNPFNIGKESDGSYEEAKMVDFSQDFKENPEGNTLKLTATYEFRGKLYTCDFGEVPAVNEDGTITLDGVDWRVLPILSQNKAGVISYRNNIVIKQKKEKDIALTMSKDPDDDTVIVYGVNVPIDTVVDYLNGNKDVEGLTSGQKYALNSIDPIVYERFPDFPNNLRDMKKLKSDEPGDLSWRRCIRYEDIVKTEFSAQMRRMGVTFRTNLKKRKDFGEGMTDEELDQKYPLFYQVNITDNIKSDLVGRSNVQYADNLNPIAALSQGQKISYTGPGGYNKDKAPADLRMPHKSHEGIIDPMDISSGKNVGLTGTLSMGYIGEDRFIHKKNPNDCLSPSDFIPYKHHDDPSRGTMAVAHLKQACPIVGGEDPIIKTKAWDNISGAKLGANFNIAYVPMAGVYEDAVVISQSAADKMTTIQSHNYECSDTSSIKVGQRVERKQKIGNSIVKNGGIIKAITPNGYIVETEYKMGAGDKLAGRHGNKCVVSRVVPDDEMPKILNEKTGQMDTVQIVMSPMGVIGRKNLGQIMETNEAFGNGPSINKKNTVVLGNGKKIQATAGKQFCMRLNHIAEHKLSSFADELDAKKEAKGSRLGEMESILLSTDKDRLRILDYLRHQEGSDSHKKLHSLLKAIGVNLEGVKWDD